MKKITVKYDGKYPNLCAGRLTVTIGDKSYQFSDNPLSSGGSVTFDKYYNECITSGPWSIKEDSWPDDFPPEYRTELLDVINDEIPQGCCGGCV